MPFAVPVRQPNGEPQRHADALTVAQYHCHAESHCLAYGHYSPANDASSDDLTTAESVAQSVAER